MENYPATIIYPEAFSRSKGANSDGVFDWSWTQGCFGLTNITPMDFDGVVERNGHYLIFETKDIDKDIPRGQMITLENLKKPKSFTVMFVWGKSKPELIKIVYANGKEQEVCGMERARERVKSWFKAADEGRLSDYFSTKGG